MVAATAAHPSLSMPVGIAIAIGDPNGIGPEIAVKAAVQGERQLDNQLENQVEKQARNQRDRVRTVLVGDAHVIAHYAAKHGAGLPLEYLDAASSWETIDHARPALLVWPVAALAADAFRPGTLDARAGKATIAYAGAAVDLARRGMVQAVVGCPHSETAINNAGIAFSGYPPLVSELTGTPAERVFLMLVANGLRIAHVTLHESVACALGRLTPELVVNAGLAAVEATRRLGVAAPRLGLFGINPHAGEGGLFGDEDERITGPAAQLLRAAGVTVEGPVGADLLLGQRRCDVYLAIFHDQGHIPIKLLSPLRASALTIGTDVLFSSVGHGCAFDIAGRDLADPVSVIETIALLGHAARPIER
ncbi:MAG: Terephthalate dihydrodiol dehydrogenase [Herminiimonas sp.]|nr:Terephthalate dihydrodiol dehydrogenase [Herminiimonas sp.]